MGKPYHLHVVTHSDVTTVLGHCAFLDCAFFVPLLNLVISIAGVRRTLWQGDLAERDDDEGEEGTESRHEISGVEMSKVSSYEQGSMASAQVPHRQHDVSIDLTSAVSIFRHCDAQRIA